jgi:hypothetical protein
MHVLEELQVTSCGLRYRQPHSALPQADQRRVILGEP